MPIIKSAQKRMRQEITRRNRNRQFKNELRDLTKSFSAALATKDSKKVNEALNMVVSQLDKAVKKNTLHKNNAARKKSALHKQVAASGIKLTGTKAKKAPAKKPTTKKAPAKKPAAKKAPAKKKTTAKKS